MLGGKNKQPLGYTIVEVMIVLAVSGMMFLIAANFINGKQERTAFTQGSNDLNSQVQNIVEDVTDGHYSDVPINCAVGGGALSFPAAAGADQGGNQDCVFLAKLLHFYKSGTTFPQNYQVFSLADARSAAGSLPNTYVAAIPGLTNSGVIPQGIYVTSMIVHDTSGAADSTAYNIGFTQGLGSIDPGSGEYQTGARSISLIYATGPGINNSGAVSLGEGTVKGTTVKPAQDATVCLTDGKRRAKLLIGGASNNSSQLNISVQQQGLGTVCT